MSAAATSLDHLLEVGKAALSKIDALGAIDPATCHVCYHFFCPADEENDRWGEAAECVQLSKPIFDAMPFDVEIDGIGGSAGVEAWESVYPTNTWLNDRLPRMLEVASAAKMTFLGWSFEPKKGPIVSAGVNIMNASSPEGCATIDGIIEFLKAKKN
ncbi:hypothetical protein OVY48_21680 [Sphingobium sp. SA2]|uniref:hypothetical protein n=1 Tax=Sphingobium sp. SA2 TaxID=1524832 RepID=UPI0028C2E944|nr:hypothetical protein [Sphingobium sp. SA2]MDT7536013.1 hypothetical protein [Sphingobium sp. SA2]